jgi:chromosomal replication initiator protein
LNRRSPQGRAAIDVAAIRAIVAAVGARLGEPATRMADGSRVTLIQEVAAAAFGVDRDGLVSARKAPQLVAARFAAIALAREFTQLTLAALAAQFGRRDHSTIIHALDGARRRTAEDPGFAGRLAALRVEIALRLTAHEAPETRRSGSTA